MGIKRTVLLVVGVAVMLVGLNITTKVFNPPQKAFNIKEINYYPKDFTWLNFWSQWPLAKQQMDDDLDKIQELGANTVRIFIHPFVFGYPEVETKYLDYLDEALSLLDAHQLKAHVTLFDLWWSWNDIEGSQTWMTSVVEPFRNDPRILIWELQNEVDLEKDHIRDWVQVMFPALKELAGNTLSTVSVIGVEWLDDVKKLTAPNSPEIYSLHWYPSRLLLSQKLPADLERAFDLIGDAELLIGEFGFNTYTLAEEFQANMYRDILYYANQKGIKHLGAWTFSDFPETAIEKKEEQHFGLFRLDGTPKPAAMILKDAFHGHFPASPTPVMLSNTSFERVNPLSMRLDNWQPWDVNWTMQNRFEQDCTTAYEGACSVQLFSTSGVPVGLYTTSAVPVGSNTGYGLKGVLKTQNLDGWAQIVMSWLDAEGNRIGDTRSQSFYEANASEWTDISIEKTKPLPGARFVQIYVQMMSTHENSIVWFDDLQIILP